MRLKDLRRAFWVKSNQQALIPYSYRRSGRLASRLLLKIKPQVALVSAGLCQRTQTELPRLLSSICWQWWCHSWENKMNLRAQSELRTLMVAMDLWAKKSLARAADIIVQRVVSLFRDHVSTFLKAYHGLCFPWATNWNSWVGHTDENPNG